MPPPTSRSSLFAHSFPAFYACYLLKSAQTPLAKATYIGSTPSPPRRIRQHNGELTQGARKTRLKRPWVMQMIVHGFPSKLAALQFEWAWQHPHVSRHLRDPLGKPIFGNQGSNYLKTKIEVVRAMVSNHPFNKWPLHVKLFTEEAVKHWTAPTHNINVLPLPTGFTCSVELEGVDGKSGKTGSGRKGPLSVTDEHFTSAILAKNTALVASSVPLECSVCKESLDEYAANPLTTCLCPTPECTAVSHMICLSRHFLDAKGETEDIIPRGGHCKSCNNYILWGDIVRGSYRRGAGGAILQPADDEQDEKTIFSGSDLEEHPTTLDDSSTSRAGMDARPRLKKSRQKLSKASSEGESFAFDEDLEEHLAFQPLSETPRTKAPLKPKPRKLQKKNATTESSGESFDFPSDSSTDSISQPPKKTRGRPPKCVSLTSKPIKPSSKKATVAADESSGESFGFRSESSTGPTSQPPKKERGRPRKCVSLTSKPIKPSSKKATVAGDESSGESFDFGSESSTGPTSRPPKMTRGRPRKYVVVPVAKKLPLGSSYSSTTLRIPEESFDLRGDTAESINELAPPALRTNDIVRISRKPVLPTGDEQFVSAGLTRTMGSLSLSGTTRRQPQAAVEVIEVSD